MKEMTRVLNAAATFFTVTPAPTGRCCAGLRTLALAMLLAAPATEEARPQRTPVRESETESKSPLVVINTTAMIASAVHAISRI